ncbi:MAG: tRNA (adenosine(37)-N6)-dimethylallyltransferase MiaA [Candidatus Anammoxibacter sp.]
MKQHLCIITGPTASGKTDVALYIARQLDNAEIISADSMQVYRNMDIGTAKVPVNIRKMIPHHLIDIIDPWESYNMGKYVKDARNIISKMNRDKSFFVVGGTGLYIRGLTKGVFKGPAADWEFRDQLQSIAHEKGSIYLHNLLNKVDPVSAARLHPKDHKRVIRAIEVYEKTGTTISKLQKLYLTQEPEFEYSIFVINRPKEDLYKRIDNRIEKMFERGLVNEVIALKENPNGLSRQAQQALGYKETLQYLDNKMDIQDTKDMIKQSTKKFAKRQMTWFRSFSNTFWINSTSEHNSKTIGDKILKIIEKRKDRNEQFNYL